MLAASIVTDFKGGSPADDLTTYHAGLMSRLAENQDREAFRALFDHFGPRVKAFLMKSGADNAMAEDMAQDVMVSVWRKAASYAPERGSVSAWIFTIARNARIDRLRKKSSRPYEDIDSVEIASPETGADQTVYETQIASKVGEAMAELPEEQQKIVQLAYIHDLPQSEIARKLGLPLGTVKSRMRLAYGKLRTSLESLS